MKQGLNAGVRETSNLPTWFESEDMVVCGNCRREMLKEFSAARLKAGEIGPDEVLRASDFANIGKRPWAGNDPGDRYMQCDQCLGQWGPDA